MLSEAVTACRILFSAERIRELFRYGAIGVLCLSLKVGIVVVLTDIVGLHYLVSLAACSVTISVVGYLLNKYWTFHRQGTQLAPEFLRYAATNLANIAAGVMLTGLLVESVGVPYSAAIVAAALALAPLTYLVHRGWAFRLAWRGGDRTFPPPPRPA